MGQPFRIPIPSEPWAQFVLDLADADPLAPGDYFAVVQGDEPRKLNGSVFSLTTIGIIPVISGSSVQVTSAGNVIAIRKSVPSITTIVLPATPDDGRQLQVADWAGNASAFPITVSGNGHLIQASTNVFLVTDWQAATFTYSAFLNMWNMT